MTEKVQELEDKYLAMIDARDEQIKQFEEQVEELWARITALEACLDSWGAVLPT